MVAREAWFVHVWRVLNDIVESSWFMSNAVESGDDDSSRRSGSPSSTFQEHFGVVGFSVLSETSRIFRA
jgi:hypothetical protein